MVFDPCPHHITQIVLQAGAIIRALKGLPEEKNITKLYQETAPLFGLPPTQMNSMTANHYPTIEESEKELGAKWIPRKACPKCDAMMILSPICQSCADAEGGKYKTGYKCVACGFVDDKSPLFFSQRLKEMGVEIPEGMKQNIGIKTITDEGLK